MGAKQTTLKLDMYPLDENNSDTDGYREHIGKIWLDDVKHQQAVPTIVVVDASGSMGDVTKRFVNVIIPMAMSMLSYALESTVDVITFGGETSYYEKLAVDMKSLSITNSRGTQMAPAIKTLLDCIRGKMSPHHPIRVLTISDGAIDDREETEMATKDLIDFVNKANLTINSQAVRLFTSESQPDSRAFAGLLQMNNSTACQLVDFNTSEPDETIAKSIAALFQSDNFERCRTLSFQHKVIVKFPWNNSMTSKKVVLVPGWNIFWAKVPHPYPNPGAIMVGDKDIDVMWHQDVTHLELFQNLMDENLACIVNQMTILKVLRTEMTNERKYKILKYFEMIEESLAQRSSTLNNKKITNSLAATAMEFESQRKRNKAEEQRKRDEELTIKLQKKAEEERMKTKMQAEKAEERRRKEEEEIIAKDGEEQRINEEEANEEVNEAVEKRMA